jgi:hypothetical protein
MPSSPGSARATYHHSLIRYGGSGYVTAISTGLRTRKASLQGAVDRADLLALPSDNPKNAWRKPETITVDDEPPPNHRETARVRVKAPAKPAHDGPDKDFIGKEFVEYEGGWRYRVIRIRTRKDGTRVRDYRQVLKDGGLKGKHCIRPWRRSDLPRA